MAVHGTHYQVLELPRDAHIDAIKNKFRELALKWHPDKNGGSAEAAEMFKKVKEAHRVLNDPHLRESYDATLGPSEYRPLSMFIVQNNGRKQKKRQMRQMRQTELGTKQPVLEETNTKLANIMVNEDKAMAAEECQGSNVEMPGENLEHMGREDGPAESQGAWWLWSCFSSCCGPRQRPGVP